jgi:hypothetical protein
LGRKLLHSCVDTLTVSGSKQGHYIIDESRNGGFIDIIPHDRAN